MKFLGGNLTNLAIALSFSNISTFQEFPKRFERSKAIERLERLERTDLRDERSIAIEPFDRTQGRLLERLELAIAWVKGVSTDSQAVCNCLDDRVHGGN